MSGRYGTINMQSMVIEGHDEQLGTLAQRYGLRLGLYSTPESI